jgi:hypothetical protein
LIQSFKPSFGRLGVRLKPQLESEPFASLRLHLPVCNGGEEDVARYSEKPRAGAPTGEISETGDPKPGPRKRLCGQVKARASIARPTEEEARKPFGVAVIEDAKRVRILP